ncbi:MAG: hypothetical protein A2031_03915 [Deltaproteobacteria bacterium RBG_19FT_COMBO_43_11]|nr:MAG: hypothetical protein A2031_03915 [Deltaproteobacteria bacterium RBG_19FT_COMBO_43_11]
MKKTKGFLVQHSKEKLVFLVAAVFMLLTAGCSTKPATVVAQGQTKAYDTLSIERQTKEGIVIGEENNATNTLSWKGIPFAKPPVGDLRWKEPQSAEKRQAPLKANTFCEICPQYIDHDRNPATLQVIQGKEDCLYLNIWRPKTAAANLPVFFWIHGGGNSIQWPLLSKTDASLLAAKANMIVVTVNYRLGPMGFFSHPALKSGKSGDEKTDSGNFALLDLIQALSWVKDNIKAFGGNPENVTIAGESAGGYNVICLIASPLAKNLFHRAVSQSGGIKTTTIAQAAQHVDNIISKLLVKDKSAKNEKAAAAKLKLMTTKEIEKYLRSKSAGDFLEMYPEGKIAGMIKFPTSFLDGTVLPLDFYGVLKVGKYNKVPVILGTNKEEAKLFLRLDPAFAPWLKDGSLFSDPAKAELYNLAAQYQSDGWKVMGVDNLAKILKSNIDQPNVYTYQFLWGAGGLNKSVLSAPVNLLLGACHAMEIDFVFGTDGTALGLYAFNAKNRPGRVALSNAMMDYWAQFAHTGDPNRKGAAIPLWEPWSNIEGTPKTILLDADFDNMKIQMSNKELTNADIEKALKMEPRQKEIQPFWDTSRFRVLSN